MRLTKILLFLKANLRRISENIPMSTEKKTFLGAKVYIPPGFNGNFLNTLTQTHRNINIISGGS